MRVEEREEYESTHQTSSATSEAQESKRRASSDPKSLPHLLWLSIRFPPRVLQPKRLIKFTAFYILLQIEESSTNESRYLSENSEIKKEGKKGEKDFCVSLRFKP